MAPATAPISTRAESSGTRSLDYVVRSGVSGGVAGCAAKTLIAPLDRVKILFQTGQPQFTHWAGTMLGLPRAATFITKTEGFWGLFRGHSATLARIFPYAAIKFVAYEQIRSALIPSVEYEVHTRRFMVGSLAGLASVIFTYPLDVVRVQLAYTGSAPEVQHARHRLIGTMEVMWHRAHAPSVFGRLSNFYPGFTPTLMGVIPYAGMSFFAHDLGHDIFRSKYLRQIAVRKNAKVAEGKQVPLQGWAELLAGGLSGIIAQTTAYPFEVIRRRMQVSGISGGHSCSVKSTISAIYRELGMKGFFMGLSIGYIKVGPMAACSFYVYEKMKYLLAI